jgi:branched-chain amino acid aminotransferase
MGLTGQTGLTVRRAGDGDLDVVLSGVLGLLRELSGDPTRALAAGSRESARAIIGDRSLGTVLVASTGAGEAAGILTASCQSAIRAGGPYLLIQELYVSPEHRSAGVGAELIRHLARDAAERGLTLVEVGLPGPGSDTRSRTRGFYLRQGFTETGPRMRRVLEEGELTDE